VTAAGDPSEDEPAVDEATETDGSDEAVGTGGDPPYRLVLERADGSGTTTVEAAAGETVLDAAERVDAGLPFGCLTGACATCTAELLAGEIHHRREPRALKTRHLDAGYVLACIAVPRGDCRLRVGSDVARDLTSNPWR
jgi:ferredoxin